MVVLLGLGAAVFLAVGFVVQQHVAAVTPPAERLSPRLLVDLACRPVWLIGVAAMVVGQVLGAIALGRGNLTIVEPLLAANVLFALPMAAAWSRQRLGRREWAGAVMLIAGLVTFVVAAGPGSDLTVSVSHASWTIAGLSIVAVAGVLVWLAKRQGPAKEATLLAIAAGVLYGLQDALTQRSLHLPLSVAGLGSSWEPYSVVSVAIVGMLLTQSAYQAAPLAASLPALAIAEPITGIALGTGLFGQGLRLGALPLLFELVAIGGMVCGLLLVTRSPIVTGRRPDLSTPVGRSAPGEG